MKYLPISGPQAPFKDGPVDAEMYSAPGSKTFYYRIASIPTMQFWQAGNWVDLQGDPSYPILGRRRVIAEPNYWTAEDQKAGRLPEVGCKCVYIRNWLVGEIVSIDDSDLDDVEVCLRFKDKSLLVCKINSIKPIETPDEKAARLRSEWCSNALGSASILSGMQEYELKRLGGYIGNIYDAILSGELPVPGAEGGS